MIPPRNGKWIQSKIWVNNDKKFKIYIETLFYFFMQNLTNHCLNSSQVRKSLFNIIIAKSQPGRDQYNGKKYSLKVWDYIEI